METRPHFNAFHRPVVRAGIQAAEAVPLADWSPHWAEARNVLLAAGLATYHYGLLMLSPAVDIEMEITFGK